MVGYAGICKRLVRKRWHSYDNGIEKAPEAEAIYVIGKKNTKGKITYLYAGHSGGIDRRLREHRYQNLAIDTFIKNEYCKNGGRHLRVKWELSKNSKLKEEKYIQCIENITGDKLIYNRKKGNSAS